MPHSKSLKIGLRAPAFRLSDQHSNVRTLADYHGQWLLLYFYPKDDTPGCTAEACSLRDHLPNFKKIKAVIVGISADSIVSHQKFASKYRLTFSLLADTEKKMVTDYGVWRQKKFLGHVYMGIARTSFLIDPNGKIAKIYEGVKPAEHAKEVMVDLQQLREKQRLALTKR